MKLTERVYVFLDKLIDVSAGLAGAIVMFLTLLVCADVAMRSILNHPIQHVTEVSEHGLLFIAFLGAAWTLKKEGHVKVDVVYNLLNSKYQAYFNCLDAILGATVCLVVTLLGGLATWIAFQKGTVFSTSSLSLPRAPILAAIPMGTFLLFIVFLAQSYRNLNKWRQYRDRTMKRTEK